MFSFLDQKTPLPYTNGARFTGELTVGQELFLSAASVIGAIFAKVGSHLPLKAAKSNSIALEVAKDLIINSEPKSDHTVDTTVTNGQVAADTTLSELFGTVALIASEAFQTFPGAFTGAAVGAAVGELAGPIGAAAGTIIGAIVGELCLPHDYSQWDIHY
jgi:hypothetical protein